MSLLLKVFLNFKEGRFICCIVILEKIAEWVIWQYVVSPLYFDNVMLRIHMGTIQCRRLLCLFCRENLDSILVYAHGGFVFICLMMLNVPGGFVFICLVMFCSL